MKSLKKLFQTIFPQKNLISFIFGKFKEININILFFNKAMMAAKFCLRWAIVILIYFDLNYSAH